MKTALVVALLLVLMAPMVAQAAAPRPIQPSVTVYLITRAPWGPVILGVYQSWADCNAALLKAKQADPKASYSCVTTIYP